MISPEELFNQFSEHGIDFYSGVPDSLLKDMCAYITDNVNESRHIIAANEGNALSLGIGYHLATEKIPLIYLQNSGLGNVINPLLSLADPDVYSIPLLLLVGWRGEPGVLDEPQHKKQGRVTCQLLDTMEIKYFILKKTDDKKIVKQTVNDAMLFARENNAPVALVVQKGFFEKYQLQKNARNSNKWEGLNRVDVVEKILLSLKSNDVIVSTTGVASRELFELRKKLNHGHEKDFLTVGGMGHASQIALGIALGSPEKNIYCLDGDGAFLMHMGSAAINAAVGGVNYKHILLNNNAHESVGGQSTLTSNVDFVSLATSVGYAWSFSVDNEGELSKKISDLSIVDGPAFLEVKIQVRHSDDLGRPTTTPQQNKYELMEFLR